jgi:hypothetical protein
MVAEPIHAGGTFAANANDALFILSALPGLFQRAKVLFRSLKQPLLADICGAKSRAGFGITLSHGMYEGLFRAMPRNL